MYIHVYIINCCENPSKLLFGLSPITLMDLKVGIVLEMYGTGNGPSNKENLFKAISMATERGVIVVALSQCLKGGVSLDTYSMGREFQTHGVVSGNYGIKS